jgi:ribose transport system ATP-binding protein
LEPGATVSETATPVVRVDAVSKAFPGVQALREARIELYPGVIHALVGENGAGKSTLIKILTGIHRQDSGKIDLYGSPAAINSPIEAFKAGIATIYQEFTLVPQLPVNANLFLGRERTRLGLVDSNYEREEAVAVFRRLGVNIDPNTPVADLSIAHQQIVEIARALLTDCRVLIMDEPTAALTPKEVESLFAILRELKEKGIGILFISHRLDEVLSIADRITVMRDGNTVGTWDAAEMTKRQLIIHMVGRPLEDEYPARENRPDKTAFEVRSLTGGRIRDISFSIRRGEILGLAGLMGAGRTEVARLIFGADSREAGEIFLDGRTLDIRSPGDAIRNGICLLTEDRKSQGLVLKASSRENFSLPNLNSWSRYGFIDQKKELSRFKDRIRQLNIRLSGPGQKAEDLSGGNQQKLLVARWLESNFEVIIFDEPTRGIDVGAKYEMYILIDQLASAGKMVMVISSDLPEIIGMSDRILVMRDGRISGEIENIPGTRQEDIMALAI